ncbi:hypothetical protein NOVO_05925 [Rickettsiales bacterium Ac37b]|nr:hypothetical protein NOVO_05925 [Rickettsiales bacterium Ac37b]
MKQKNINFPHVRELNFLEHIEQIEGQNPEVDIINLQDSKSNNQTYLHKLAYTEFFGYVAYFLEKGANLYAFDNSKLNPLHCASGRASYCIKNSQHKSLVPDSYQIFKLLLKYEAEQRAYYPKKYQDLPWLKDQQDNIKCTPLVRVEKLYEDTGKEVVQELKKALKEQEAYYQECLEAKAKGIVLTPYHKKFLPEIIKSTSIAEEKQEKTWQEKTWSEKILEGQNSSLRHRSKSDEPLQTKQEAAMKSISRSMEVEKSEGEKASLLDHNGRDEGSFVEKIMGWFTTGQNSSKSKGL